MPLSPQDDPAAYETETVDGRLILRRDGSGTCIYLGKTGCTIHDRKPAICRNFDCRRYWTIGTEQDRKLRINADPKRWRPIIEAGKARVASRVSVGSVRDMR